MNINTTIQSQPQQISSAGTSSSNRKDAKLQKACQDFEGMLVSQMLSQMRQTVQKTNLFGSSEKEEIFQGMMDNEIAQQVSKNGSMGIADTMYAQLSKQAIKS